MRSFEIRLPVPKKADRIKLASVCCLHFGARGQDKKRALNWRDFILSEPNTYVANLGDDMENAIPGDEEHNSMMWDSDRMPADQYMDAADYWQPVAEAGRLLWTSNSNHAWRSEAKTGRSVARELNIFLQSQASGRPQTTEPSVNRLPRWANWQTLVTLYIGRLKYVVHSWHGVGSGCTPEAALRKCRSMASQHRADLYLMGHAHQRLCWKDEYMIAAKNGELAIPRERAFACTGGYLGWHDTYAERKGLAPNKRGSVLVELGVRRWDIKCGI